MSKQSGLGDYLLAGGYDLSNDVQGVRTIGSPQELLDVTGINKSAFERIGGQRDAVMSFDAYFNDAATHGVLSALPTTSRVVTYCRGLSAGSPAASMVGFQIGYDGSRDQAGNLTFAVENQGNGYGLDWGETFGSITDASGSSSASMQSATGGATTYGWQAYAHMIAFNGTDCTLTLESSSDDGGGDAFASIGAFTQFTGIGAERIAGTGALEEYVRVTSSGTFTSVTYVVSFVRNVAAVTF